MMLTGRNVRAGRAKSLGLVDAVVPERHVEAAASAAVTGTLKTRRGGMLVDVVNTTPGRKLAARRMRARDREEGADRALSRAPRPDRSVGKSRRRRAAHAEGRDRIVCAACWSPIRRETWCGCSSCARSSRPWPDGDWSGRRVHVIGAGAMGGDIAAWCAWHGFTVTLADMKAEPLGKAIARAAELFGKIGHKRTDIRDALDRLIPDLDGEGVRSADLVIEAVPETLELKRKVYAATEPQDAAGRDSRHQHVEHSAGRAARRQLQRPEQLVGMHFFNPVSRMQLVEVVSHDQVSADVLAKARAFLGRIDRLPAPVKSAPGLPGQPRAHPLHAGSHDHAERGDETRDHRRRRRSTSACRWDRSSLPIRSGLDICLHVAETLKAGLDRPMPDLSQVLRNKVDMGELGRKTGKGFYTWKNGKAVKERGAPEPHRAK